MSKDLKTIYNRCAYSPRELQNFVNDVIDGTISGTGLPSIEDTLTLEICPLSNSAALPEAAVANPSVSVTLFCA